MNLVPHLWGCCQWCEGSCCVWGFSSRVRGDVVQFVNKFHMVQQPGRASFSHKPEEDEPIRISQGLFTLGRFNYSFLHLAYLHYSARLQLHLILIASNNIEYCIYRQMYTNVLILQRNASFCLFHHCVQPHRRSLGLESKRCIT